MIAVSVTVGIGVMIDSFRQTVVRWLAMTLQSDVYVSVASRAGGFSGTDLDPAVAAQALALPGVAGGHTIRRVELPSAAGPIRIVAIGAGERSLAHTFELKEGRPAEAFGRRSRPATRCWSPSPTPPAPASAPARGCGCAPRGGTATSG